jgi:hypothetical protein
MVNIVVIVDKYWVVLREFIGCRGLCFLCPIIDNTKVGIINIVILNLDLVGDNMDMVRINCWWVPIDN